MLLTTDEEEPEMQTLSAAEPPDVPPIPLAPASAEPDEPDEPEPVALADPFNGLGDVIQEITRKACDRINDCRGEWGYDFGNFVARKNSLGAWRQYARMRYAGDVRTRATLGGVFGIEGGNLSLNTGPRIIRLLAAQHANDLVGNDPFLQAMPANIGDQRSAKLSKQVERKVQTELSKSNARQCLAESIRVALNEGERPIKITWETDETQFTDDTEVMVDKAGEPIQTRRGQYIYPKDDWITVVAFQAVDPTGLPAGEAKFRRRAKTNPDGSPAEQLAPGEVLQIRLKKEPSYLQAGDPAYAVVPNLTQKLTNWNGLRCDGLFGEDFIYPPTVPSLRDPACDIMAHCYDAPMESVAMAYENAGFPALRVGTLSPNGTRSQASMPQLENGENENIGVNTREMVNIHETYYRCRVRPQDKAETWLFIVIDYQSKLPIYAQQLAKMKLKRPPFMILRGLESEPGRAYGLGVTKKFHDRDVAIDVWFNRAALKSSMNSSITLARKNSIKELKDKTRKLEFGTKHVYELLDDGSDSARSPAVQRINLNEMSEQEFELLRDMVASGEAEFGVVDSQGNNSESARGKQVATAVRNIERTGNSLQQSSKDMQAADIAEGMEIAVDAILENMIADEEEWTPGFDALATLDRDEIVNLPRDIRLQPSRAKGADLIEISNAAKQTILEYYSLSLQMRRRVRDQYIVILKNYGVQDADDKLEEPTEQQIHDENQAAAQKRNPPLEKAVLSLKDIGPLTPNERGQALELFGIVPDSQAAVNQMRMQEAQASMPAQPLRALPNPDGGGEPSTPPIPALPAQPAP